MFFYIALAVGALMCAAGLGFVGFCLFQPFSLNNLQPMFHLAAGLVLFVFGAITISLCIRIKWMRRIERKLNEALQTSHEVQGLR